ncbi:MAG: hypothetical protein ACFFDW_12055, partial [Candidatus Thorarchaeota archaeon]
GIIVYSLGNFIFPDIQNENCNIIQRVENKESFIFQCNITNNGIEKYEILPVCANEKFQPILLAGKEKNEILEKLNSFSEVFYKGNYDKFWKENKKNT